jgi:single-strand DNA-binding protein
MAGLAKMTLIGNLGADPEHKLTAGGTQVCNMRVAVSEKRKGEDVTQWFGVVAFGKTGELAMQYLKKGSKAYFEGPFTTREWTTKEGEKRVQMEVVANTILFLDGKKDGAPAMARGEQPALKDDDIPF